MPRQTPPTHRLLRGRRAYAAGQDAEAFAAEALQTLRAAGLRVTLNNDADKIGAKIRTAQLDKVPYMLVIGEKEAAVTSVAVRHSKKGDLGVKTLAEFVTDITTEVKERSL
jgi:threonyl-tRNA synthetase